MVKQTGVRIKTKAAALTQQILDNEAKFMKVCKKCVIMITPMRDYNYESVEQANVYAYNCKEFLDELSKVQDDGKRIENDRKILGMKPVDYGRVYAAYEETRQYCRLWNVIGEVQEFYEQVLELDVGQYPCDFALEQMNTKWLPELHILEKIFSNLIIQFRIISLTKTKLLTLKKHDKVFRLLTRDCLRKRHWISLNHAFDDILNAKKTSDGSDTEDDPEFIKFQLANRTHTIILGDVYHSGVLLQRIGTIRATVNRAKKELDIEIQLEKMKMEWQALSLVFKEDDDEEEEVELQRQEEEEEGRKNTKLNDSTTPETNSENKSPPPPPPKPKTFYLENINAIIDIANHQLAETNKMAASKHSVFQLEDLVYWKEFLKRSIQELHRWQLCHRLRNTILPFLKSSSLIQLNTFLKPKLKSKKGKKQINKRITSKTDEGKTKRDLLIEHQAEYKRGKEKRILRSLNATQIQEAMHEKWNLMMLDAKSSRNAYNLLKTDIKALFIFFIFK